MNPRERERERRYRRGVEFIGLRLESELLDPTEDLHGTELCFHTTPEDLHRAFPRLED